VIPPLPPGPPQRATIKVDVADWMSFDERVASLMGVNVNIVVSVTFALGSALAAAGGILFALRDDQGRCR
jgi:hypothetical protein